MGLFFIRICRQLTKGLTKLFEIRTGIWEGGIIAYERDDEKKLSVKIWTKKAGDKNNVWQSGVYFYVWSARS